MFVSFTYNPSHLSFSLPVYLFFYLLFLPAYLFYLLPPCLCVRVCRVFVSLPFNPKHLSFSLPACLLTCLFYLFFLPVYLLHLLLPCMCVFAVCLCLLPLVPATYRLVYLRACPPVCFTCFSNPLTCFTFFLRVCVFAVCLCHLPLIP